MSLAFPPPRHPGYNFGMSEPQKKPGVAFWSWAIFAGCLVPGIIANDPLVPVLLIKGVLVCLCVAAWIRTNT
jgi:hypothetical protein